MRTLVQHEKWDLILDGTTLPDHQKPREQAWRHCSAGAACQSNRAQAEDAAGKIHNALVDLQGTK